MHHFRGATVGVVAGLAGDRGGVWRYGDDGGDDLDGVVAVWWLRQQRAAKVAAAVAVTWWSVAVMGDGDDGATVGVVTGLAGDGGGVWRYGDDGGDDLDGFMAVWWLQQQRAAKVAAATASDQNFWPETRQKREQCQKIRWEELCATVGVVTGLARDGGGAWRYGDDGGDDLDGFMAVWWLQQQRAAKVAAAAASDQNFWQETRQKR
nr:hypothetical protein [Tanacetum cinerariifolium]